MGAAVFLGLATVDVIYSAENVPHENEKIVAHRQEVLCGGPAANAAVTCAFLGQRTKFAGAVGKHPLTAIIRDELRQHQIPLIDLDPSSAEMPPVSSILVNELNGNRSVISGHATRKQMPGEAFDASVLENAKLLMVDGHQMSCAIRAATKAKERGIPVVLDGGSWKERTDELLAHTQIAICSENFRPPGAVAMSDVTAYVLDHGVPQVAITRGAKAVVWATRENSGEVAVPRVKAVDTLGAGDIFHGAFCYQVAQGLPFVRALQFAGEVAAKSCQFFGTRSWMDSWQKKKV